MYRKLNYKLLTNSAVAVGTVWQGMWSGSDRMRRRKVQILRRFSAQEHDTDTTIPVSALVLWNLLFTQYISVYLYTI